MVFLDAIYKPGTLVLFLDTIVLQIHMYLFTVLISGPALACAVAGVERMLLRKDEFTAGSKEVIDVPYYSLEVLNVMKRQGAYGYVKL